MKGGAMDRLEAVGKLQPTLTGIEQRVLLALAYLMGAEDVRCFSNAEIGKQAALSRNSVYAGLRGLAAKDVITVQGNGNSESAYRWGAALTGIGTQDAKSRVTECGTQIQNKPARDCHAETHPRVPVSDRERAMSAILKNWDGSWPPPLNVPR
jgi:DNA-binding CsgD family transcriptional regulator